MKKIIVSLIVLCGVFFWMNTYAAQTSLLHGTATWANVTMNFDDASTSTAAVMTNILSWDACGTNHRGFILTWHVNRKGNGYVYLSEPDGDNTVHSCTTIILSGSDFYLTWVGKTASGTWYKMTFNDIKLNYNKQKKAYYFSGDATDEALWSVPNWWTVYVTWLNLIDWNNTIVDYSALTGWNYVANGNSTWVNVILKDVGWNPVQILNNITVEIDSATGGLSWYTFLTWDEWKKVTLDVNTWVVTIPMYILKAVSSGSVDLKFSYSIADQSWHTSHIVTLSNLKTKKPLKNIKISFTWNVIVWNVFTGNFDYAYYSTGTIDYLWLSWNTNTNSKYGINLNLKNEIFTGKVIPKNKADTISKINSSYNLSSYTIWFNNFSNVKVKYSLNKTFSFDAYADKIVDYSKSFTGKILNTQFSWWNTNNTLSFKPVLRDSHGYVIPDVKFDIKIEDAWIANSYSGWDCNELSADYQTNCKALEFVFNWTTYSWSTDNVLWSKFNYKNNISVYSWVKVVSYKPITGWKLKFEITNLQNTSSGWNFTNSWNYLKLPSSYIGYIKNIVFKPFLKIRLQGLDDKENYVDINNSIYLKLQNMSKLRLWHIQYSLSGQITKPISGVSFATWGRLTWNQLQLTALSSQKLSKTILFSLNYHFDGAIKFNYNHGYYGYNIAWIWNLKLKPWSFYFNLWATYKVGWAFVNGMINETQKYSASVKNSLWATSNSISAKFYGAYNQLRRKVNYLLQWITPIDATLHNTIKPNNLNWWIKYYFCNPTYPTIMVNTWTYAGSNTIILKNCKLLIKWNITKNNINDNLVFFLFDDNGSSLDSSGYLTRESNIYIANNVSDIHAALLTKWSIFTIHGNSIHKDNVLLPNRTYSLNDRQLYIGGALMWRDNVWGSFLVAWKNKFTIWWSKKIGDNWNFWWVDSAFKLRNIAQVFDINFWRWFRYGNWDNSIAPSWYSNYCKAHKKQKWCKYPVYIQYDPAIKNNILFK